MILETHRVSALAHARGCIAVLDGAQAVGSGPVNAKAPGCEVYAASGRKWLLAPKGTGLLYLSEGLGSKVDRMALQGGRAADSNSFNSEQDVDTSVAALRIEFA